ncbi:MAG TPA: mismatch-specific DNA-glycosylase [Candidatus Acidoferrales bacterium]|jgi:TDG/mug DNA glycosylase family protein|nr:mismatch-specific DNA-glycosylase [Candidatus Acidoferrales bacterium]
MKTLPDYLRKGMRVVIVGCNPGEQSARVGHYYAGRNNVFWTLMYESGVVPEEMTHKDDRRVIEFGIGLTDIVKRPTRGEEEISREEFAEGRFVLAQKLEQYTPRVVAFNGKNVYEKFAQRQCSLGLQKDLIYGARVFVLPSTSGQNTAGRSVKMRYFRKLAKFLVEMEKRPRSKAAESPAYKEAE